LEDYEYRRLRLGANFSAESFNAEGDDDLDIHSGSYHGIKNRSYGGVKYIRQGNLLKCKCGYEQNFAYPYGCYSCGPEAHHGQGHIVGFTPNGRIVWKDECTGRFMVDTDGKTDVGWFNSGHQCKEAESFSAETWWTNCEKCGASTNHSMMLTREDYYVFACSKCNTPKQVAAGDEYLFDNSLSAAESFNAQYDFDKSFNPKRDNHSCWYDDHQWVCEDIDARNQESTFDITLMCEECGMIVDIGGAVGNLTKQGKGAESFAADSQTRVYRNLGIGAALVAGLAYWIKR